MIPITITIPEDNLEKIKEYIKGKDTSVSRFLRKAALEKIENEK